MNSFTAARALVHDYSVSPDIDLPATYNSADSQDTRQSAPDFRAELLMMIPQLRAFSRMLSCNKDSGEEISLKTLAEAWSSRPALRPETDLKTWLFIIARNKFYCNRDREQREASPEQAAAKSDPSHGVDPIQSADNSGTVRALRFLPDRFREALVLVSASGCSYDEAARICGCPVGTVKSRVFRARQALVVNFDMPSS
jgi:RNA polymerase sigma-70 factor (ECF subfamily)